MKVKVDENVLNEYVEVEAEDKRDSTFDDEGSWNGAESPNRGIDTSMSFFNKRIEPCSSDASLTDLYEAVEEFQKNNNLNTAKNTYEVLVDALIEKCDRFCIDPLVSPVSEEKLVEEYNFVPDNSLSNHCLVLNKSEIESAAGESVFNESLANGSAFTESMVNESGFNESVVNESAFTESIVNESVYNESVISELLATNDVLEKALQHSQIPGFDNNHEISRQVDHIPNDHCSILLNIPNVNVDVFSPQSVEERYTTCSDLIETNQEVINNEANEDEVKKKDETESEETLVSGCWDSSELGFFSSVEENKSNDMLNCEEEENQLIEKKNFPGMKQQGNVTLVNTLQLYYCPLKSLNVNSLEKEFLLMKPFDDNFLKNKRFNPFNDNLENTKVARTDNVLRYVKNLLKDEDNEGFSNEKFESIEDISSDPIVDKRLENESAFIEVKIIEDKLDSPTNKNLQPLESRKPFLKNAENRDVTFSNHRYLPEICRYPYGSSQFSSFFTSSFYPTKPITKRMVQFSDTPSIRYFPVDSNKSLQKLQPFYLMPSFSKALGQRNTRFVDFRGRFSSRNQKLNTPTDTKYRNMRLSSFNCTEHGAVSGYSEQINSADKSVLRLNEFVEFFRSLFIECACGKN